MYGTLQIHAENFDGISETQFFRYIMVDLFFLLDRGLGLGFCHFFPDFLAVLFHGGGIHMGFAVFVEVADGFISQILGFF